MAIITVKRILPDTSVSTSLNTDNLVWIQDEVSTGDHTCIMMLDNHEIYVQETRQQIEDLIKSGKD